VSGSVIIHHINTLLAANVAAFSFYTAQFIPSHSLRHSNRLARYSAAYPNTRPTRVRDDVLCRHYFHLSKFSFIEMCDNPRYRTTHYQGLFFYS
ncbi:hypothetical protein, partial [Pectobacterium aquaticum]|uniref:hypothetical protein n=1 Tax=Pectobacterium aquaticum TaxID=2204145 RepID=UPI001F0CE411